MGLEVQCGTIIGPQDAIQVVLSTDPDKVHGYSVHSSDFTAVPCLGCGAPTPVPLV